MPWWLGEATSQSPLQIQKLILSSMQPTLALQSLSLLAEVDVWSLCQTRITVLACAHGVDMDQVTTASMEKAAVRFSCPANRSWLYSFAVSVSPFAHFQSLGWFCSCLPPSLSSDFLLLSVSQQCVDWCGHRTASGTAECLGMLNFTACRIYHSTVKFNSGDQWNFRLW